VDITNVSEEHNASMFGVNPRCHDSQHNMNYMPGFFLWNERRVLQMAYINSLDCGNWKTSLKFNALSRGRIVVIETSTFLKDGVFWRPCYLIQLFPDIPTILTAFPTVAEWCDAGRQVGCDGSPYSLTSINWNWRTQKDATQHRVIKGSDDGV
jgi:hypothetical protein